MDEQEYIEIDLIAINKYSKEFLINSKLNPFYDKQVYFTTGLRAENYIEFQIIGNMGGHPSDYDFKNETDFYIIADSLIEELRAGTKDIQLVELQEAINAKGNKHKKLRILSESAFLQHMLNRCHEINDLVTLGLINRIPWIS